MGVFDRTPAGPAHEQVVFCQDRASGLRAIVAIYSTALGPAVGGTRFHPYVDEDAALSDVLALSRAMAYKAAVSGLDVGGGKAVILGDPARDKTEPLLRAYGRMVESLGGRYWTACDVGTYVRDMDVVARESRFVTGRSPEQGGAGDSAVLTAYGVFSAMRAAAEHSWGAPTLRGRRVGVEGVGKVGGHLVGHLLEDGARVAVSDVSGAALERVRALHPQVEVLDVDALPTGDLDVYAPCALGGSLTDEVVGALKAAVVCGAANNQLAHPGVEAALADRGVLYTPDYVANAGGLLQVADEAQHSGHWTAGPRTGSGGFRFDRARARAGQIFDTTAAVLRTAAEERVPPAVAADRLAERRMADVARLRSFTLPC